MAIPFTIQNIDNERLIRLKDLTQAKSKVDVLRAALDVLEKKISEQKRLRQWRTASKRVAAQSGRINQEFQKQALFKKG